MSDEATPTTTPAPSSPAPSAPVSSTPAAASGSPSNGAAGSSLAEVPSTPPAAAKPSEPTFDWEAWDGADDKAPEPFRPVISRVRALHEKTLAEQRAAWESEKTSFSEKTSLLQKELEAAKAEAEALLDDNDPRFAQAQAEVQELRGQLESIQSERDRLHDYFHHHVESQAEAAYKVLEQKYPKVLSHPHASQLAGQLVGMGVDYDVAFKTAEQQFKLNAPVAPPPKPSDTLISGATGRPGTAPAVKQTRTLSNDEARDDFVGRYFGNH